MTKIEENKEDNVTMTTGSESKSPIGSAAAAAFAATTTTTTTLSSSSPVRASVEERKGDDGFLSRAEEEDGILRFEGIDIPTMAEASWAAYRGLSSSSSKALNLDKEARHWLKIAAMSGSPDAWFTLAVNGFSRPQTKFSALRTARSLGHIEAMYVLAQSYEHGNKAFGCPVDRLEAITLYTHLAKQAASFVVAIDEKDKDDDCWEDDDIGPLPILGRQRDEQKRTSTCETKDEVVVPSGTTMTSSRSSSSSSSSIRTSTRCSKINNGDGPSSHSTVPAVVETKRRWTAREMECIGRSQYIMGLIHSQDASVKHLAEPLIGDEALPLTAMHWFRRAAKAGILEAQYRVAKTYLHGIQSGEGSAGEGTYLVAPNEGLYETTMHGLLRILEERGQAHTPLHTTITSELSEHCATKVDLVVRELIQTFTTTVSHCLRKGATNATDIAVTKHLFDEDMCNIVREARTLSTLFAQLQELHKLPSTDPLTKSTNTLSSCRSSSSSIPTFTRPSGPETTLTSLSSVKAT